MKAMCLAVEIFLIALIHAHADTALFTTLHSFNGSDGAYPLGSLIQGNDGNFYGTSSSGGTDYNGPDQYGAANGYGTVFKMTPSGAFTTLVFFNGTNGSNPTAGLVQDNDGNFYGTAASGGITNMYFPAGWGTVFKMTPAGNLTNLMFFNGTNGANPRNSLIQDNAGNLYGPTYYGGTTYFNSADSLFGDGTVFKINTNSAFTTLHSFSQSAPPTYTNPDGSFVNSLIRASNGILYGTTISGGDYARGTLFILNPSGDLAVLTSLDTSGVALLMQSSQGDFYGATDSGSNNFSVISKITTNGILSVFYVFTNSPLIDPTGLMQGKDGNFYGTTYHGGTNDFGTVFQLTPSGILTVLHSFTGGMDGANPFAGLVEGADGLFYGTAQNGGVNGYGTIFRLAVSPISVLPPYITSPMLNTNGQFQFTFDTAIGRNYSVEYSTNLTQWYAFVALSGVGVPITLIAPNTSSSGHCFYRIAISP